MTKRIYPIDWRDQFDELDPYLNGHGGVVRICYPGEKSAPSAFLEALKSEYECKNDHQKWRSIRIDPQIYSVRYLSGVRDEFIRKLGITLPDETDLFSTTSSAPSLEIFTDVEARRDVQANISDVKQENHFHINSDNPALMFRNRGRWIDDLCKQLTEYLTEGHHMMVVINHGSSQDQDEFWRYLWRGKLEKLAEIGLLLIHMINTSDENARVHDFAPLGYPEIHLPATLNLTARGHAIQDLKDIIKLELPNISPDEAHVRAETLVNALYDDIPKLHRSYAAELMRLSREIASRRG